MNQVSNANTGVLGRLKFLAKDTMLYGFANAFSKLISVIVFPLLTNYFSVESYGKIDILFAIANLLVILMVFGQDSAVARFYYEHDKDGAKQKEVVSWSLYIQIVLTVLILPIIIFNADLLAAKFTGNAADGNLVLLIAAMLRFGILINFSGNILKWTFKRKEFLVITMGSSITYLCLVAIAVLFFKPTVVDIFYLYLFSRVVFGIVGFLYTRKYITKVRDIRLFKNLMRYAAPYGFICVIAAAIPSLDRYFITNKLDVYQLGIYAVGYKVAAMLSYPVTAFQTAWGPFYLSQFKEKDINHTFNEILTLFSSVIFFIVISVVLLSDIIVTMLASDKYIMSVPIVFPIILSIAVTAIKDVSTIGIDLSMKTQYRFYSSLLNLGAIVLFILLLIKPFGILGVAYALLIGSVVQALFEVYIAKKFYAIKFSYKSTLVLFFVVLILSLSVNLVSGNYPVFYILCFRVILFSCFIAIAIYSVPTYLLKSGMSKIKARWKKK